MGKEPFYKNKKLLVSSIGLFMILIMVLSALNMGSSNEKQEKITYNNYKFTKQDNYWVSYINNQYLSFEYNPYEIENLTLPNYNFNLDKYYIAYNPIQLTQEMQVMQILNYWLNYFNTKPTVACYEEKGCPDIPLIDCKEDNSIKLIYSNQTKVYIEDKCFVLQGTKEEQTKYIYKIVYSLLGVIQ
ncbi:MAG: hypothetical protein WC413_00085 [Candidatus Nanoarchaeia archaeon]